MNRGGELPQPTAMDTAGPLGGNDQGGQQGECSPFIREQCDYDLFSGAHACHVDK